MKYQNILLALLVVVFGFGFWSVNQDLKKVKLEFAHMDEEVDEINTNIKRLSPESGISVKDEEQGPQKASVVGLSEYDFGKITKEGGVVSTEFKIKNSGEGELKLSGIVTSCSCTSAKIDKEVLKAGEEATLTAYFDPNVHEEPEGRFSRSIYIKTNDQENKEIEFKIYVEILK